MSYPYNGILFSLKKEGNSNPSYNMDELWGHHAKWDKLITKEQILYNSTHMGASKVVKFIETERMVVAGGWE